MAPEESPADVTAEETQLRGLCDWIDRQGDEVELAQVSAEIEQHLDAIVTDRVVEPVDVPLIVPVSFGAAGEACS